MGIEGGAVRVSFGRALLDEPEADPRRWFRGGKKALISGRCDLQQRLSEWVEETVYPEIPLFRNELINRDQLSSSANTGHKRLLAAMLTAPNREDLGIAKTPSEKSLNPSFVTERKWPASQARGQARVLSARTDPMILAGGGGGGHHRSTG